MWGQTTHFVSVITAIDGSTNLPNDNRSVTMSDNAVMSFALEKGNMFSQNKTCSTSWTNNNAVAEINTVWGKNLNTPNYFPSGSGVNHNGQSNREITCTANLSSTSSYYADKYVTFYVAFWTTSNSSKSLTVSGFSSADYSYALAGGTGFTRVNDIKDIPCPSNDYTLVKIRGKLNNTKTATVTFKTGGYSGVQWMAVKYNEETYTVTADNENLSEVSNYASYGSFNVPTGKNLNIDVADNKLDLLNVSGSGTININNATTKTSSVSSEFTGTVNVNNSSSAITIQGILGACEIKKTSGTLTYTGTKLNGTTLDGAILGGSERITTSGTVTIKDLAGNNLNNTNNYYAFVGSETLIFDGTCDLTKKSDGTDCNSPKVGYPSTASVVINAGANVTTGDIYNANGNNAAITNNGTITATYFGGAATLAEGSITTLSNETPFRDAVTISGDATLNLTASTATLSQAITVAEGKTLTIDGNNNAIALTGAIINNGTIEFKNATLTLNLDDRSLNNLTNYIFTNCTATLQFTETGDEYKNGGFTITGIPAGVTVKVKQYDATEYETVTPVDGTATISHAVEVSGTAAWLDYTFNESTKATNIHSPADQVITNAGNAGSGNNLTIDTGYNTDNSYNEDGTLKVMSTPWRDITWPTNYTVAVAGNVPDVENGCLVAFGSTTAGSQNYLAIIRGASQNEIKLVKGHGMNNAFEVISTMTAANATALSHLVVFTKNGDTFTVYLDGVQKAQVTYSETLGGGLQLGSLHGGVTGTNVGRVNDMSAEIKANVFAKAIRVYDYVISSDQMAALTVEFPYTSFGGKYSRTITANSNLSATDAWLNASTQGNVDVPVNAIVDAVTYYPDVEITTTAASTLTVNADMDAENIKFDGAGKLTIASDGTHNIHIYGSLTANGPVSVKYGETDLSAVPVSIGESGSLEFDFSAHDFSSVSTSTDYPLTGNTIDYGGKVTGVYPSDEDHSYTLAFNGTTNSYYLTVAPTIVLKAKLAIDLVKPYYDGRYVGEGLGKYTISLGETSYSNLKDFGDAVSEWGSLEDYVEPTITINIPTDGFYRFKIGEKYMCSIAESDHVRTATSTSDDATTVFYLDNNSYLIGYADGYGFNFGYCKPTAPGIFNLFEFSESSQVGTYDIHTTAGTGNTQDSDRHITINGNKLAEGQGTWTIEEVTTLPVTITKYGMRTFSAPVALRIPDGVHAYTVSISGTDVTLTEVETTIPANTPVILYNHDVEWEGDAVTGTEQTYYFAIDKENTASKPACVLSSIFATKAKGDNDLTLQYDLDNKVFGFWQASGDNIKGFSAYLEWNSDSNVRRFVITTPSTGIESVQETPMLDKNIYDVQGRRVEKATKGLYIINRKKVIL